MNGQQVIEKYANLDSLKTPHLQTWRECFRHVDPLEGAALNNNTGDGVSNLTQSNSDGAKIYDSTAADAISDLTNAIISGVVPSNMRWVEMDVAGQPEVRDSWLDDAAETVWREIHASNFDAVVPEFVSANLIGGMNALYIDDDGEGGLIFERWPLSSIVVGSERMGGEITTIGRKFKTSVSALMDRYGEKSLSASAAAKKGAKDDRIDVIHMICPRNGGIAGSVKDRKPIASYVVEAETSHVILESGHDEQPFVCPRWRQIPDSPYAVGQVHRAIHDIKTLNDAVRMHLQAMDMHIGGMWYGVNDGVINPSTLKIGPRRVVMVADKNNFGRLDAPGNPQIAFAELENQRNHIRRMLLADRLAVPQQPGMTATEINVRMEMLRQQVGPMFGRFLSEFLQQLVIRSFAILLRSGRIPQPPESIAGADLDIRFVSPFARTQRAVEVQSMERFEAGLFQKAQALQDPSVLDVYDMEAADREKAWLIGVPQKFLRDANAVTKIRKARQQAQQQQGVEQ